jgi:hypothetical protein
MAFKINANPAGAKQGGLSGSTTFGVLLPFPGASFGAARANAAPAAPLLPPAPAFMSALRAPPPSGENAPPAAASASTEASLFSPTEDLLGRFGEEMPPPRPKTPSTGGRAGSEPSGGGGGGGEEQRSASPSLSAAPAAAAAPPAVAAAAPLALAAAAPAAPHAAAAAAAPPLPHALSAEALAERSATVHGVDAGLTAAESEQHELVQSAATKGGEALQAEVALARSTSRWLKGAAVAAATRAGGALQQLVGSVEAFLAEAEALNASLQAASMGGAEEAAGGGGGGGGAGAQAMRD